jgi:hypothetical protein
MRRCPCTCAVITVLLLAAMPLNFTGHAGCCLQVEVIMVDKTPDGAPQGRYSIGWAMLPLPAAAGKRKGPAEPAAVPMMAGTPRYLLHRWVTYTHVPHAGCWANAARPLC